MIIHITGKLIGRHHGIRQRVIPHGLTAVIRGLNIPCHDIPDSRERRYGCLGKSRRDAAPLYRHLGSQPRRTCSGSTRIHSKSARLIAVKLRAVSIVGCHTRQILLCHASLCIQSKSGAIISVIGHSRRILRAVLCILIPVCTAVIRDYHSLTSYTDDAIKQACKNMCTDGYSFGDYTYSLPAINADYSVSAQSGGVVKLTNKKWAEAELQRYVEQIEEAIDDGEFSVKLLPGNYPDQDGSHYAFNAYNRVRKDSYTTASGKVSGEDYVLFSGGSNKDTDVFSASIQYPLPVMDEEEAQSYYIGLIEDAIRNRETEVQFQYKFGDQDYSDAAYAAQRAVTSSGYEVDSLVYWTDYRLSLGTNSYSGIMTITIQYQQAPAAPQGG